MCRQAGGGARPAAGLHSASFGCFTRMSYSPTVRTSSGTALDGHSGRLSVIGK